MKVLKELVSKCASDYSDYFNTKEIEEILSIDGGMEENITMSSGAHLELCRLRITGIKTNASQEEFQYERHFYPGINTLISDNLKGKSTIFKCIKFALTGRDKLRKNMSEWIQQIFLEFKIGETMYTSHIDNSGSRVKASLYRTNLEKFDAQDVQDIDLIFSTSTKDELENRCEQFFYKQLGINSLKWTQKDSRKDVNKLHEAGTSWDTFFKTIYLESKDSSTLMYGAQGKLLFQILLGLGLTTSMNRLKIKKEQLQFDTSFSGNATKSSVLNPEELISDLKKALETESSNLLTLQKSDDANDISHMVNEKSSLVLKVQAIEEQKLLNIKKNSEIERITALLNNNNRNFDSEWKKLEKEKQEIQKKSLRINEHIEIGSFFSNLEIKSCPSCNSNVERSLSTSIDSHNCQLCHHEVQDTDRQEDVSRLEAKIAAMHVEVGKIETQMTVIQDAKTEIEDNLSKNSQNSNFIDVSINDSKVEEALSLIKTLEENIYKERSNQVNKNDSTRRIKDNIAILNYRISEAKKLTKETGIEGTKDKNITKINLLDDAIQYLEDLRVNSNESIIEEFKTIMLATLHSLGLDSFTNIEISSGLDITYAQGGERLLYKDITEGEQLRVKVALYLSLVQLNSEHGVGNHPRFLIIDSPGKEEADDTYFDGFIDALNTIEEKFSDKIQIIIGSADRRLSNLSSTISKEKQEIKEKGETFF